MPLSLASAERVEPPRSRRDGCHFHSRTRPELKINKHLLFIITTLIPDPATSGKLDSGIPKANTESGIHHGVRGSRHSPLCPRSGKARLTSISLFDWVWHNGDLSAEPVNQRISLSVVWGWQAFLRIGLGSMNENDSYSLHYVLARIKFIATYRRLGANSAEYAELPSIMNKRVGPLPRFIWYYKILVSHFLTFFIVFRARRHLFMANSSSKVVKRASAAVYERIVLTRANSAARRSFTLVL